MGLRDGRGRGSGFSVADQSMRARSAPSLASAALMVADDNDNDDYAGNATIAVAV